MAAAPPLASSSMQPSTALLHRRPRLTHCVPLPRLRRQCALRAHEKQSPAGAIAVLPVDEGVFQLFSAHVSGEWEGVTATFEPTGAPQQLPDYFVPDAFREWGVQLFDWQTQISATTDPSPAPGSDGGAARQLRSLCRRLLPTVGCEADAIAFTEEALAGGDALLLAAADGSYSVGPAAMPAGDDTTQLQLEHCFALQRGGTSGAAGASSSSGTPQRLRLRVVQKLRRNWAAGGAWVLSAVELHKERWDGPFTGKRELAGCGGGQPGIAQLPALLQEQLHGCWSVCGSIGFGRDDGQQQWQQQQGPEDGRLSCINTDGAAPHGAQLTLLPLGAWSLVLVSPQGQLLWAEAGVLLPAGDCDAATASSVQRAVSIRRYHAGGIAAAAALGIEALRA